MGWALVRSPLVVMSDSVLVPMGSLNARPGTRIHALQWSR